MPEPRPVQTYSTLLEDRRIIEAAAEANEPSSLVVHLLEKEWTISTGKVAHPGPGARRFSYSQPISSLLDDIQARRIPSEFTDIFRKLDVKFFEGCLLVEMHDSRPPAKGGPPKPVEPSIAKYVLRPTAESLWADIRNAVNAVDTQKSWGDKEALELEARLVLSTAPPLCLDPSPTVNRIANVVMRSSAYGKTSFKRKQNEDADDDGEIIKRRKLMQLMNPRVGKPFTPTYRALMHKQAPSQKPSAIRPPPAPSVAPAAPPQNLPRPSNGPTAPPAVANNPAVSHQLPQASLQSQQQAQMPARHRSASIKVPPDARQAAAAAARSRGLQTQVANAQQQQAAGAMRAAAGAQVPGGPMPMANGAQNQHNVNAAAQLTAIQNARAPFPLTLPGTKHPSTAMGGASPPKPTTLPPGVQGAVPNLPQNGQSVPSDATAVQQTPRLQNATPSNTGPPPNPANQTGMQAYHQNLVNEAQNSMLQMNVAQQAYNAATANVPGVVRPQYNINYAMAMARQAQLGAGMPGANAMNTQQLVAYQQQMGMVGQPMHPRMQMQMQQAGYGGVQMMQQPPSQTQQQQNQNRAQQYMQALFGQANQLLSNMTQEDMQKLVETKTTDQLRNNPQWLASDITGKARTILIGFLRTQHANRLAQATAQQVSQAAN